MSWVYKIYLDQLENVHYNSKLKASILQQGCQVTKLALTTLHPTQFLLQSHFTHQGTCAVVM